MARADFAQTKTYNQESDFIFDEDYFQFDSVLGLKLIDNAGQNFTEDFTDDTDHIYDSGVSEFSAGKWQQKDQRPAGATFGATYTNDINGGWGGGIITGTAIGSASISAGKLDLAHGDVRYVDYDATNNADSPQTGCIRFKLTPNYSGAPTSDRWLFCVSKAHNDIKNCIQIRHSNSGPYLRIHMYNSAGALIVEHLCGTWSPTSGQEYEIELNWDLTTGETRLFIDGTQSGTTYTGTATRDSNIGLFRVGNDYDGGAISDFVIDDVIVFSSVQHTTNYTAGYSVPDYIYADAYDLLPEMEYTGAGTLVSFDELTYTKNGDMKIALEVGQSGVYTYWNGSAWVAGNGTKDYMCTIEDFENNVEELGIDGEIYGQFKIFLPESNTQGYIDELTASLTAQIYPTSNPKAETSAALTADEILSMSGIRSISGNDLIKAIIKRDGCWLYHNGTSWVTSDETYSQSNTISEISIYISDINNEDENDYFLGLFFHSADGSTTPTLSSITMKYFSIDFVVEDGTSKEDATSYATIDQFYQYWINKGADYSSESILDIKQWLNEATEYIDLTYTFEGELSDYDQSLEWPRSGVLDRYGYELAYDEVPHDIINATCYMAAQAKLGSLNSVDDGVRSISYGPVSKTFINSQGTKIYKAVDKMIKYLVIQGKTVMRVN